MSLLSYYTQHRKELLHDLKNPKFGFRTFKYVSKGDLNSEIEAIRDALKYNIDLDFLLKSKNNIRKLTLPDITSAVNEKEFDVNGLIAKGYSPGQIAKICTYINSGVDVRPYIDTSCSHEKISIIGLLLLHGVDVGAIKDSIHAISSNFNIGSMSNLLSKIPYFETLDFDFMHYLTSGFNYEQIMEICYGHEMHLNIEKYSKVDYDATKMAVVRSGLEIDIDISPYVEKGFNAEQLQEILKGLESGIDVSRYAYNTIDAPYMRFIRKRLVRIKTSKENNTLSDSKQ